MPDRPLLMLPNPGPPLDRIKRPSPIFEYIKLPTKEEQSNRFSRKFRTMIESTIVETPDRQSPENILVIETIGKIENFKNAVNRIEGLEWQHESDLEEISSDDAFFQIPKIGKLFFSKRIEDIKAKDSKIIHSIFSDNNLIDDKGYLVEDISKETLVDKIPNEYIDHLDQIVSAVNDEKKKQLSGRLYLSLSNRQALEKVKHLFEANQRGQNPPDLIGVWKDLFSHLRNVRFWDVEDRIRDTGIIELWNQELEIKSGTSSMIAFEVELAYSNDGAQRKDRQKTVEELVKQEGGQVIASCEIPEIRFHALKIELPVSCIERAVNEDYGAIFAYGGIAFFRPNPQSSVMKLPDGEVGEITQFSAPDGEPVIALFDGYPFAQHACLKDFLDIDDPDGFLEEYEPNEFRHGTAMASLICHGELDADNAPLFRRLYVRPIFKPNNSRDRIEQVPEDVFFEDLVERSVRRMFEGEGDIPPTAPNVKIINLSVGDPNRVFLRHMSPMARLLDWLSFKYKVLFCVSAGNALDPIEINVSQEDFNNFGDDEKITATLKAINNARRNRRILSPGESINAITIGATHDDSSIVAHVGDVDILPSTEFPSPISSLGLGFRSAIKPDILFPGGRQLFSYIDGKGYQVNNYHFPPGQKVAGAPINQGDTTRTLYARGTSNATALATRSLGMIYDVLEMEFEKWDQEHPEQKFEYPEQNIAPLLKALLVHGASWQNFSDSILNYLNLEGYNKKNELARFLGYGKADVQKSLECAYNRATGFGYGSIEKDDRHEFKFPVPSSLAGMDCWRRLTITLAWLSPISNDNRSYRKAALAFDPAGLDTKVGGGRSEADWRQVKNGTVQHEIIEGKKVGEFIQNDHLVIPVQCREDSSPLDVSIPYGLAVSLEVKENVDIAVYNEVKTGIEILIQEQIAEKIS